MPQFRPPPAPARCFPAARAQLSLVEHALCPLDTATSLQRGFRFEAWYAYSDVHRNRRKAKAVVGTLDGLSAHDELYLWGLLGLALAQPEPQPELLATPYYCLRHLGLIDADGNRGGKQFEQFRDAIRRLAGVRYQNDHFYDPLRGEHRQVSFGFLNYSLPLDAGSSRAWRFAWDPIFFEFAQATGGALSFDLTLYCDLSPASRRLYLYLKKLFWRQATTGAIGLRHLTVDVLGFSGTLATKHLKHKLTGCVAELLDRRLIVLPAGIEQASQLFVKRGKGEYAIQFHRGPAFSRSGSASLAVMESPLVDPLRSIGFDDRAIGRLLAAHPHAVLEQWADITLAARERRGEDFFKKSPQAYFMDNVQAAAAGTRTPPDWWRELRKRERQQQQEQERSKAGLSAAESPGAAQFEEYLHTEAKEAFARVMDQLRADLRQAGQNEPEARRNATYHARLHFWNRYRQEHPEADTAGGFQSLQSLL
ncbi:MAG: hypothetical protein WED34_09645 [Planctomycetales bacterium]